MFPRHRLRRLPCVKGRAFRKHIGDMFLARLRCDSTGNKRKSPDFLLFVRKCGVGIVFPRHRLRRLPCVKGGGPLAVEGLRSSHLSIPFGTHIRKTRCRECVYPFRAVRINAYPTIPRIVTAE